MKLIRLTKEAENVTKYKGDKLIFNTSFKDDLTVNPNAKVAFQSIYFDEFGQDLIIDTTNDIVEWDINSGTRYSIILDKDEYTKLTYPIFFKDFTNKLNKSLVFDSDTMGREWKVDLKSNGNMAIEFKYGNLGADNFQLKNVTELGGVYAADLPIINDSNYMYNRNRLCKGAGYLRAQIAEIGEFDLGFTESPLNVNSGAVSSSRFFLTIGVDASGNYTYYDEGILNTTAVAATQIDVVEIRINEGTLQCLYYDYGTQTPNILYEKEYINDDLYAFTMFRDGSGELAELAFSDDPYIDQTNKFVPASNLGDIPIPANNRTIVVNMSFANNTFANILGYNDKDLEDTAKQISLAAENQFHTVATKYLYSIKLLNVNLESYDSERQGKNNILYVINTETDGQDFSFTPPYLTFLELKNNQPLSLRNIRCEVVDQDDNIIEFQDKAIMTLIVED